MRSERLGDPAEQLIDAVISLLEIQPAEQRLERGRMGVLRDRCRLGHGLGLGVAAVTVDGLLLLGEVRMCSMAFACAEARTSVIV